MKYEVIRFDREQKYIRQFLDLPSQLYNEKNLVQNYREERSLLQENHVLSRYISLHKYLVIDRVSQKAAARALLTESLNDNKCYVGYFECAEDQDAADLLLNALKDKAAELGYQCLTGPVNASFWIGYRFKTDCFDSLYTGEPYNLSYYPDLFEKAGFKICDRYKSNRFRVIETEFSNDFYRSRLAEKEKEGYRIISPDKREFTGAMREIYRLIVRLYADFPVFQMIDEEAFCENYGYLKYIIDYRMIKLAYYGEEMVGFFISIPNYGNCLYGKIGPRKMFRALKIKCRPDDYVMLYMGVTPQHRGIGKALAEAVMRELQNNKAKSVGALIHEGKINGDYFSELVEQEYHYALYSCSL